MKRQLGDFAYFPQNNRFLPEFRRSIVDWMFKVCETTSTETAAPQLEHCTLRSILTVLGSLV